MFNNRMRSARMQCGFTLQYVADYLNVSLRNYQRYEQGVVQPSLETLVKFADLVNVSIDWLLHRDNWIEAHVVYVDVSR